jgi:hypothetical protein
MEEKVRQLGQSLEAVEEERSSEGRLHQTALLALNNQLAELRQHNLF